jgi:23S rRNA (cytosine1962-C5)-methyltransferase
MDFNLLKDVLQKNSLNLTKEFKRIFHGRGNFYKNFSFLTIDSIDTILNVALYDAINSAQEDELFETLYEFTKTTQHTSINVQRRYLSKAPSEVIFGTLKEELFAIENSIKFTLDLKSFQNNGYFPDMKNGREYIQNIAKDKNVLNLFSYTCGFSLSAIKGNAKQVFNMDMSKQALTKGRANHHLNNFSTKNVHFGPYNILKSFSKIKKYAPYDIIIIDPPTFQKGSFEASKDYIKIIKKLESVVSYKCIILSCLNSPFLDENFIINMFTEHCSSFKFDKRLKNCDEFVSIDESKSLKNLVFKNFDV